MKHSITPQRFGALGQPMADAVQACVHCGFCLPACPTYQVMGEEMDSPRGRIVLMKQVLEGHLAMEKALPHIDACLGCLSCETACPSGVQYRDLISPFRAIAEDRRDRPLFEKARRWLLLALLPHPRRFAVAAKFGRMAKPLARLLPASLRAMLDLLPDATAPSSLSSANGISKIENPRARIALLAGCAQQVLAPEINQATIEVLHRNRIEVVIPRQQGCCGALAWHVGEKSAAENCARQNVAAFPGDVDAILTNAAGCGSCLHEYPLILAGTESETAAESFAKKAMDAAEFLDRIGLEQPADQSVRAPFSVTIQDACHLLHGQKVQSAPRRLLQQIPGVEIREMADPDICCGSAGTYNLDHPETAAELGRRKIESALATGAAVIVSGNIGCLAQMRMHLAKSAIEKKPRICHTMELLAEFYRGGE